jgi:hypothetical protein
MGKLITYFFSLVRVFLVYSAKFLRKSVSRSFTFARVSLRFVAHAYCLFRQSLFPVKEGVSPPPCGIELIFLGFVRF